MSKLSNAIRVRFEDGKAVECLVPIDPSEYVEYSIDEFKKEFLSGNMVTLSIKDMTEEEAKDAILKEIDSLATTISLCTRRGKANTISVGKDITDLVPDVIPFGYVDRVFFLNDGDDNVITIQYNKVEGDILDGGYHFYNTETEKRVYVLKPHPEYLGDISDYFRFLKIER